MSFNFTFDNLVHSENIEYGKSQLDFISTVVNSSQLVNGPFPIFVTVSGITTDFKSVLPKHQSPKVVTLCGIVIPVILASRNAFVPISVTVFGIVYVPVLPVGNNFTIFLSLLNNIPSTDVYVGF